MRDGSEAGPSSPDNSGAGEREAQTWTSMPAVTYSQVMVVACPIGRRHHSGEIIPLNWSGISLGFPWWRVCKWLGWGVPGPGSLTHETWIRAWKDRVEDACVCPPFGSSPALLPPFRSPYGPGLSPPLAGNCCWTSYKSTTGHNECIPQRQAYKRGRRLFKYWFLVPLPRISDNF